jgi:hypothetical protein
LQSRLPERIKLDWSTGVDIGEEYFPADILDRRKYAEFLTQFLAAQGFDQTRAEEEMRQNYVLNLNSKWGAGKTYLLRRWADDLKKHFPVVYIDAWKQDYSEDPLMTVVSSLIKQLREQAGKPEDAPEFKAPRKLIGLLKAAAPSVARSLTKRYLGIDPVAVMEAQDEEGELGSTTEDSDGKPVDMGFAASKVTEHLIKEHDAKSQAIDSLKKNVENWIKTVILSKRRAYPAFIFIDELDRCRPSYAVEMLETIKHIFDIKGVVFVVATDTEQLQHAVKAVYGAGFDARVYLGRFFNSSFSLRDPDFRDLLQVHCDKEKLTDTYFKKLDITVWPQNDGNQLTIDNITTILNIFSLATRIAIQVTERLIAILCNLPQGAKIDILMLTILLCIREKDEELFFEIVSGTFKRKTGDKETSLSDFIENKFSLKGKVVKIKFSPSKVLSRYDFSHLEQRPANYEEGLYEADFIYYICNIFAPFFGLQNWLSIGSFAWDNATSNQETPCQKLMEKLAEISGSQDRKNIFRGERANTWLEYLYREENFVEINPHHYKDLVELASALDWIG